MEVMSMGEIIYGLDFKSKKRLTPELAIAEVGAMLTLEQQAVNIVGGLSLDCDPEMLLEFGGYDTNHYHAPDKDSA